MAGEVTTVRDLIAQDLSRSSLTIEDMQIRPLDNAERAMTNSPTMAQGYVIPYFALRGRPLPFYRVKLFDSDPKYKQPKDSPNHIYYPKNFLAVVKGKNYVVITEGEKKAARLCKLGIPGVAVSGVDSWRNRIVSLPKDVALSAGGGETIKAKLPAGSEATISEDSLAEGFQDLLDFVLLHGLTIIICYDSDQEIGVKPQVQRAAAVLSYELRFRGVKFNKIRQLILPPIHDPEFHGYQVGVDDYLQFNSPTELHKLIQHTLTKRAAFPRHPSIRDYINKRLQNPKLDRKQIQNVSLAILSDLDANGIRLRSVSELTYYFDLKTKRLLRSAWALNPRDADFDSPFIQHLYQVFGLSSSDNRLLVWLGTQFTSEEPIEIVTPHRVFAKPTIADQVCYQLSDSEYVTVDKEGIKIHNNGTNNILFESDQVEPLDSKLLLREFQEQSKQPLTCWWAETLSDARLKDKDRQRIATALLYYMSPWLHRWRGMQLPVELITGEAGSGKSTLYELRLNILTGRPKLRNAPQDIKDWHASVASTGGLHVTDNLQLVDKTLRQRLSDEICRIITEPDPTIEQRRYYTNADLIRIPVRAVFAITAIQQPFQNADVLQRAMILELDKTADTSVVFDSEWKQQQLKRRGTRETWIAHHLLVLQRFFKGVAESWKPNYKATHRLIHFEQGMMHMAKVFGLPDAWIPKYLNQMTDRVVSENDWVLEGIQGFVNMRNGAKDPIYAQTISEWAQGEDDFMKCEMLVNPRRLGRYMQSHASLIQNLTGLAKDRMTNNRQSYRIIPRPRVQ